MRADDQISHDALVLLGTPGFSQTERFVWLVGYRIGNTEYLTETNRYDLTAEQTAFIYKLRWDIGKFFHREVFSMVEKAS